MDTFLEGILLFCAASVAVGAVYINSKRNGNGVKKHLGVYTISDFWYPVKFLMFFCLIKVRPYLRTSSAGYGKRSKRNEADMENVHPLSSHPLAIDASYFNGYNSEGWYIGAGMQRRHGGKCEAMMFLRVPQLGPDVLVWPWSPATDVKLVSDHEWATQPGVRFEMLDPMKRWRVTFEGKLKERRSGNLHQVKYDLIWEATSKCFDMDTDMDPVATCRAISTEPWSRDFFQRLKDAHQTHYEIYGDLKGTITIEGLGEQTVSMRSMKDRSYGLYRDWGDFHRYILQYFATEDGTFVACHLVSLPVTMTHLVVGFVMDTKGKKQSIRSCSKRLYELGEDGNVPEEFSYTIVAGGEEYNIEVTTIDSLVSYCGWDWEAKVQSVCCQVKINGSLGQGLCEFEYRNTGGRKCPGDS